jgi:hypothetical protein
MHNKVVMLKIKVKYRNKTGLQGPRRAVKNHRLKGALWWIFTIVSEGHGASIFRLEYVGNKFIRNVSLFVSVLNNGIQTFMFLYPHI